MTFYAEIQGYINQLPAVGHRVYLHTKEVAEHLRGINEKIPGIAKTAFWALSMVLAAWFNPNFFWGSVCVGFIWDKQVKEKLDEIWTSLTSPYYKSLGLTATVGVSILIGVLKLPAVVLTYSIWKGLNLGVLLKSYSYSQIGGQV